jgi:hypothetical protein
VKVGIRCVFGRFDPDQTATAIRVARCESGFNPDAYGNGNGGIYQHRLVYWPGRYENLIADHDRRSTWGLSSSVYSGRTNAIVTALYQRRYGWTAWSCY